MIFEKTVKIALSTLFHEVQEISIPSRRPVTDINDFYRKASAEHYKNHIYANVFETEREPTGERIPTKINKIFFDFDTKNGMTLNQVENEVDIARDRILDRGISKQDLIKNWSGKKGFHLYQKIKPIDNLYNGDNLPIVKQKIYGYQAQITKGLPSADTSVHADFAQVSRVIGIQRFDTKYYPFTIPTKIRVNDWVKQNRGKGLTETWGKLMGKSNDMLQNWGNGVWDLDEFVFEEDYENIAIQEHSSIGKIFNYDLDELRENGEGSAREEIYGIFIYYMGKKLTEEFMCYNPQHNTRLQGASCLLEKGFAPELITNLASLIGWENFDYDKTFHFVSKLKVRKQREIIK